jgi:hypothetical protein
MRLRMRLHLTSAHGLPMGTKPSLVRAILREFTVGSVGFACTCPWCCLSQRISLQCND